MDSALLQANPGANTVTVTPSSTVNLVVQGGEPTTLVGDRLMLNLSGASGGKLFAGTFGSGRYAFDNRQPIDFSGIETPQLVAQLPRPYLGNMEWISATNAWGPVERNMSNGEEFTGDGGPLTVNGLFGTTGLGVHAGSEIVYHLGGSYLAFESWIGVDDEVGSAGSVVFQIWADGAKSYDSGLMTGTMAARLVTVPLWGVNELRLVVTDGGNGNASDHADWLSASLISPSSVSPAAPVMLPAAVSFSQVFIRANDTEDLLSLV
jgi:hypothetical protein